MEISDVVPIAKSAITNFQNLFGFKYPFEKLDLVMCPEFKYGGMENVGCICYSESHFIKHANQSLTDKVYLNVIIHHEM